MSEEKKPDEKAGATVLDDDALEAVSGGEKLSSMAMGDKAWDFVKEMFGANDDTEQQP